MPVLSDPSVQHRRREVDANLPEYGFRFTISLADSVARNPNGPARWRFRVLGRKIPAVVRHDHFPSAFRRYRALSKEATPCDCERL
jgi:hypothetical protein